MIAKHPKPETKTIVEEHNLKPLFMYLKIPRGQTFSSY